MRADGSSAPGTLAVFARPPRAGAAKTRLASAVGDEGAARLALAFLADTMDLCARARTTSRGDFLALELWSAGEPDPLLAEVARHSGAALRMQPRGDLGLRMRTALDAGTEHGARTLVIGSDAPTLPPRLLHDALDALDTADLVLGPAADGGYWLVGARAPLPSAIFDGVPWSTTSTRAATLAGARAVGLRVATVAPWYDVDAPDDLRLLSAHLALDPTAAPATALALSSMNAGAP